MTSQRLALARSEPLYRLKWSLVTEEYFSFVRAEQQWQNEAIDQL